MNKNNTSKQSIQAPNNSRCAVIRDYLVAITRNDRLAVVLNQFIYELQSLPEGGWLRITAAEMLERTLITVEPQTMRAFFRELEALGFIERRSNPLDPRDRTYEYRVRTEVINKAIAAAGFNVPAEDENVPSIKKKKNLKPFRSLSSVIKKNDNTSMRVRESLISQDPDEEKIKAHQQMIHGHLTADELPPGTEEAVSRKASRTSQTLFKRDAKTAGERALVQFVVDGDIQVSAAAALVKHVNLQEITHRSVLYHALDKFKQLPRWKLKTIMHPIRYLAEMIHNELSDYQLDRRQYA